MIFREGKRVRREKEKEREREKTRRGIISGKREREREFPLSKKI